MRELDAHAAERFELMCERYGGYIERERAAWRGKSRAPVRLRRAAPSRA